MTGCGDCFDYTTTSGRVNEIAVDPTTTTQRQHRRLRGLGRRRRLEDDELLQPHDDVVGHDRRPADLRDSIDTLTIDPNNHNTIYAGTGDLNYGSFSMGSQGILKSTDAGAHWTVLGADVFGPAYAEPAGQFPQYDAVGKVRVDPNNRTTSSPARRRASGFSYDGGANWTGPCLTNAFRRSGRTSPASS